MSKQSDRELLELAAKAAGYQVVWKEWVISRIGKFKMIEHERCSGFRMGSKVWNPLENGADALKLSVDLYMEIEHNPPTKGHLWVGARVSRLPHYEVELFTDEDQRLKATQRAIVRAAALVALHGDESKVKVGCEDES